MNYEIFIPPPCKEDLLPSQRQSSRKVMNHKSFLISAIKNVFFSSLNLGYFAENPSIDLVLSFSTERWLWLHNCTHLSICWRNIEKTFQEFVFVAAILQFEENELVGGQADRLDPGDDCILHPGAHCQILNLWKLLQAALLLQVGRAEESNLQVNWLGARRPLQV